jgi:uncharacterized membrane protein YjjP (DUF1212 family)
MYITLVDFCGIYFFIRATAKYLNQYLGLDTNILILSTVPVSLVVTIWLKILNYYYVETKMYNNVLIISELSFIFQIINILILDGKDPNCFAINNTKHYNLWIYWLLLFDKNVWIIGLYAILVDILLNRYHAFF